MIWIKNTVSKVSPTFLMKVQISRALFLKFFRVYVPSIVGGFAVMLILSFLYKLYFRWRQFMLVLSVHTVAIELVLSTAIICAVLCPFFLRLKGWQSMRWTLTKVVSDDRICRQLWNKLSLFFCYDQKYSDTDST